MVKLHSCNKDYMKIKVNNMNNFVWNGLNFKVHRIVNCRDKNTYLVPTFIMFVYVMPG